MSYFIWSRLKDVELKLFASRDVGRHGRLNLFLSALAVTMMSALFGLRLNG